MEPTWPKCSHRTASRPRRVRAAAPPVSGSADGPPSSSGTAGGVPAACLRRPPAGTAKSAPARSWRVAASRAHSRRSDTRRTSGRSGRPRASAPSPACACSGCSPRCAACCPWRSHRRPGPPQTESAPGGGQRGLLFRDGREQAVLREQQQPHAPLRVLGIASHHISQAIVQFCISPFHHAGFLLATIVLNARGTVKKNQKKRPLRVGARIGRHLPGRCICFF